MPHFISENQVGTKIGIWLQDLPSEARLATDSGEAMLKLKSGSVEVFRQRAAIEIFQPLGATFRYGLLGAEYTANGSDFLEFVMPGRSSEGNGLISNSLAGSLDVVSVGPAPEYTKAVQQGVENLPVAARPSGTLKVCRMAHGRIGSSSELFRKLSSALVFLMIEPVIKTEFEDLWMLLFASRSNRRNLEN